MTQQTDRHHENIRLGEVTRFARSLRAALSDTTCEERGPVHYYFDADVILKVILGFLQFEDSADDGTRDFGEGRDLREYLVQALLSFGLLGKIRVLRPHALEIDEKLRYKLDYRTPKTKELLAKQTRAFIDQWGLKEALTQLENIKGGPQSDPDKRRAILETLRRRGPRTFVAMALIRGGTWKNRLRQLWDRKLLVLESASPDVRVLVKTRELELIRGAITHHRGSAHDLNNLRDAAALAAISLLLRQGHQVRFYTGTKAIRDVVTSNAAVRDLLTEWPSPTSTLQQSASIIRDTEYFLIRANFAALAFGSPKADAVVAREDLQWLSDELGGILDAQPEEAIRVAARIRLGGRYLTDIIRQLGTLGFLRNVLSQAGPELLATEIDDWVRLWEYVEGLRGDDTLAEEIRDVKTALEEYVAQMRDWVTDYHELQRSAHDLHQRWDPALNPDPMRDLGMVRWNVSLTPQESDAIRTLMKRLMSKDADARAQAALTLAAMAEDAPGGERNVVQVVTVLWTLNLFALASRVLQGHIASLRADDRDVPASIAILHIAAVLRGGVAGSVEEVRRLVADAIAVATREVATESGILVGLGFVHYYAAQRFIALGQTTEADRAGEASFAAGWAAMSALPRLSLAWAFAANHCAYVGSVLRIEDEKTRQAVDYLVELRSTDTWHYRFADTLAYREVILARDELRSGGDRANINACERLRLAKQWLAEIPHTFGDTEVQQHLLEIDKLFVETRCASSDL